MSERYHLVKPTVSITVDSGLNESDHAIRLKKIMGQSTYVPNTISIGRTNINYKCKDRYVMVNQRMRQLSALCDFGAEIGCFVPAAKSATIPAFEKSLRVLGGR